MSMLELNVCACETMICQIGYAASATRRDRSCGKRKLQRDQMWADKA